MTSIASTCSVQGCVRGVKSRELCLAHYERLRTGRDLVNPPLRPYSPRTTTRGYWECSILECQSKAVPSSPVCKKHAATCYRYNLSTLQLDAILRLACQICGLSDTRMHLDHDHSCCSEKGYSCGKCIRGILCSNCNTGIGLLGDDPERLKSAIRYLSGDGIE